MNNIQDFFVCFSKANIILHNLFIGHNICAFSICVQIRSLLRQNLDGFVGSNVRGCRAILRVIKYARREENSNFLQCLSSALIGSDSERQDKLEFVFVIENGIMFSTGASGIRGLLLVVKSTYNQGFNYVIVPCPDIACSIA